MSLWQRFIVLYVDWDSYNWILIIKPHPLKLTTSTGCTIEGDVWYNWLVHEVGGALSHVVVGLL